MDITKTRTDKATEAQVSSLQQATRSKASKGAEADAATNATASTETSGFVRWSPDAALLAEGVQEAKAAPDARADKVAELKAAIQNGTYKIDARAVADRMLQSSFEEAVLSRKA
jgi:negative regulator of flagellin synthesis FlgM